MNFLGRLGFAALAIVTYTLFGFSEAYYILRGGNGITR